MPTLVPCPACQRHVQATEATCPFCARGGRRVAVSALVATTLAVGLAVAACGGSGGGSGPNNGGEVVALYGGPPPEPTDQLEPGGDEAPGEGAPGGETAPADSSGGAGGPVAAYGPPPQ